MSKLAHSARSTPRHAVLVVAATIIAAALALVWIGRADAGEGDQRAADLNAVSNVATGRADAVDASDFVSTSSSTFVDMPGMSKTFSFGGNGARPVLVLFQAAWPKSFSTDATIVRLLIDGVAQPGPGSELAVAFKDESQTETNGFNFITAPLAPGTHRATIQWRTINGTIGVNHRSLIVLHK